MEPLTQVEGKVGIVFPEALCSRQRVDSEDEVLLTPTGDGFALQSDRTETAVFFSRDAQSS